jgi:hypothetical protein
VPSTCLNHTLEPDEPDDDTEEEDVQDDLLDSLFDGDDS